MKKIYKLLLLSSLCLHVGADKNQENATAVNTKSKKILVIAPDYEAALLFQSIRKKADEFSAKIRKIEMNFQEKIKAEALEIDNMTSEEKKQNAQFALREKIKKFEARMKKIGSQAQSALDEAIRKAEKYYNAAIESVCNAKYKGQIVYRKEIIVYGDTHDIWPEVLKELDAKYTNLEIKFPEI